MIIHFIHWRTGEELFLWESDAPRKGDFVMLRGREHLVTKVVWVDAGRVHCLVASTEVK